MKKSLILFTLLCLSIDAKSEYRLMRVDLLERLGLNVNAAGPLLVQMDSQRNRLIVANTLSSSLTLIDCQSRRVKNIPTGGRALQHLKMESMTFNSRTGDVYLIGFKCLFFVSEKNAISRTIKTDIQFESVCVDENTGNAFLAGRESTNIGFYHLASDKLFMLPWVNKTEPLINMNQTPPPPVRKVLFDNQLKKLVAVDGNTSKLFIFNSTGNKLEKVRKLKIRSGGRWHLAGYNQKTHHLFLVIETKTREVVQAAKIDIKRANDIVVDLPGFREGVGIQYSAARDEIYIPYDNAASVHVVDFSSSGEVTEIKLPTFGNDASAIDELNDLLYVASWAQGEIDVIDLESGSLVERVTDLGILPHMFSIAFNPNNNMIYIPKGATAVNGTFGAAIHTFDLETNETDRIYTGWAPVDMIELTERGSFVIFSNENQFAEVQISGSYEIYDLPFDYPVCSTHSAEGNIYLSYGPHQSYWPTVYIWGAKNGILSINSDDFSFYDRRIPRQTLQMVLDSEGELYLTQNNWGKEQQFMGRLNDEIRLFDIGNRVVTADTVEREITQRILKYDKALNRLYLVRIGERDDDPGVLHIIDAKSNEILQRVSVGLCPTDLELDETNIYVSNFISNSISVVNKTSFSTSEIKTGAQPIKLCCLKQQVYVLTHGGKGLEIVSLSGERYPLPLNWLPDNMAEWRGKIVLTAHNDSSLFIVLFDPETRSFSLLHEEAYPFGDTCFDTGNVSFYVNGQFGDALPVITRLKTDQRSNLWITDFLAGKIFIIGD